MSSPENLNRRQFLKYAAVGAGASAVGVTSESIKKIIDTPKEMPLDPRYKTFLDEVGKGNRKVMQTAMEQVATFNNELILLTQRVAYLEQEMAKSDRATREVIAMNLDPYRFRRDSIQNMISGLSDPIREYFLSHPDESPIPVPGLDERSSDKTSI